MRTVLVLLLLANTLFGQPPASPEDVKPNLGQAIGIAGERSYAEKVKQVIALEAKLERAQAELAELRALVATLKGEVKSGPIVAAKIVEEMLIDQWGESICPGCEAWWNGEEKKDLERKGWLVERVGIDRPLAGKLYPRWRVCIGEECGFIEYTKDFRTALQSYLDRRKQLR